MNKQIINHFTDNDLYTFSVCLVYLTKFSRAKGEYAFVDRNNTVYPKGFAEKVQEQVNMMSNISITDEEIDFLKNRCKYFPNWFLTFLKAYKFDPNEVNISQDEEGHLSVKIKGYLWRTLWWEVPLLAIISELKHEANGDIEIYNEKTEFERSYEKGRKLVENGLFYSEFGTRRRFSYSHHELVVQALKQAYDDYEKEDHALGQPIGKFVGTSNVYFAMKYNLTPIGTMSHQFISMIGALFGYREANYLAMKYWQDVYEGDLGVYLYDTFTWKAFERNFGLLHAKSFDGLRIDSGDNYDQVEKIIDKYHSLGINPKSKTATFSNGLSIDEAIEIHKYVNSRIMDRYGIGTSLTCDILGVSASNMVIKLIKAQITENSEEFDCVKLSNDISKACGNKEEIEIVKKMLHLV